MKPGAFEYEKYHRKCEEINREAGGFENGDFLPVMQWSLGEGMYSYNSRDRKEMLEAQLDGISQTLSAKNDQPPHLEPWHGIGVFAESFGCPFIWKDNDAPWTGTIVDDIEGLKRLQKPDLNKARLLQMVLNTTEYFNEQTRGEIAIAATDTQSPLSTLSLICDVSWMHDRGVGLSGEFHRVLNDITDTIIEFTIKQRALCSKPAAPGHTMWSPVSGTGISISDDMLALVGEDFYREFGMPYDEKIGKALGGAGIHSCGRWQHNFAGIKDLQSIRMIDLAVSFDWDYDPVNPNDIVNAFNNSTIPVQARCKPEDTDTIDILLQSDVRLILSLWWDQDPQKRDDNYNKIKERWEELKSKTYWVV